LATPKKQHYVPQFYLKNFCDSKNRIFCYDKVTNKSYLANIKDIGQENLFYDIKELLPGTIEKNFAKKEDLYKIGYSQLLKTRDINKLDEYPRKFLFLFITAQYLRTAEVREYIQNTSDQAINKLVEKSGIKIPRGLRIYTHPESVKRIHLDMLLDREMIFSVSDMLAEQQWIVLQNETGIPLWTSDTSVTIDNRYNYELGLASEGREIHFPLTPKLCLTSFDPDTHKHPKTNNIEYMNVLYHNCLQVRRSMRFIYSSENDFSLATSFLKDYPCYKDPHLQRITVY
jgi:hypothetical protein